MPPSSDFPLVTIAISTYNRSWGLRAAIESALAQTYKPIEIVVSDDGSPDDTPAVAAQFQGEGVIYHRQPMNVGKVRNWGYGVEVAKGKYLVILSDDDFLSPTFVQDRIDALQRHDGCIVAFGRYGRCDFDGQPLDQQCDLGEEEYCLSPTALFDVTLSREWWIGSSLYETAALRGAWDGGAEDDLVLDWGLHLRLAARRVGCGVYLPSVSFTARVHDGQNSQAKRVRATQQGCDVAAAVLRAEPLTLEQAAHLRSETAALNTSLALAHLDARNWRGAASSFALALRSEPGNFAHYRRLLGHVLRRGRH